VHVYEPKRKHENKILPTKYMKRPFIVKRTMRAKKVMYAKIFKNQGSAMQIDVPKIKIASCTKGRFVPPNGYCSRLLRQEKVVEIPHPPYSPDLAPCDYVLFPRFKKYLTGRKYNIRSTLVQSSFSVSRLYKENTMKLLL